MWHLILFLFFLITSVWLGVSMMHHPGYLLISMHPWMVQMPIWFAFLALIFFLVLFYLLINSVDRMQFLWFRLNNWIRIRKIQKAYNKTQKGLLALVEGEWKIAESHLLAGVTHTFTPLINYLAAAKAAQEQASFERTDAYIQKAHEIAPNAELPIGLIQSHLALERGQIERAEATLSHLRQNQPKHAAVLKLLESVYVQQGDWQSLLAILPYLKKVKIVNAAQLATFEAHIYCEIFKASGDQSLEKLHDVWNSVPRAMKKNTAILTCYIKQLSRFKEASKETEELIRKVLKQQFEPELVLMYADLPFENLNPPLVVMGAWLAHYGPRQPLLLGLGKICVRVQLWGKAKDYFEKCLSEGPYPLAALEYGRLLEKLEDDEKAIDIYRQALVDLQPNMQLLIHPNLNLPQPLP